MKRIFLLLLLSGINAFADKSAVIEKNSAFNFNKQTSISLPQSISLKSGNIYIRLDGKKRYNINRIEWKNQICARNGGRSRSANLSHDIPLLKGG